MKNLNKALKNIGSGLSKKPWSAKRGSQCNQPGESPGILYKEYDEIPEVNELEHQKELEEWWFQLDQDEEYIDGH